MPAGIAAGGNATLDMGRRGISKSRADCQARRALTPHLADDEIGIPGAAFGAPKPGRPYQQRKLRAVARDELGDVRLDLVPAFLAPAVLKEGGQQQVAVVR